MKRLRLALDRLQAQHPRLRARQTWDACGQHYLALGSDIQRLQEDILSWVTLLRLSQGSPRPVHGVTALRTVAVHRSTTDSFQVEDSTPLPIYEKIGQDVATMNLDLEAALMTLGWGSCTCRQRASSQKSIPTG